jgi:hypothetical protein
LAIADLSLPTIALTGQGAPPPPPVHVFPRGAAVAPDHRVCGHGYGAAHAESRGPAGQARSSAGTAGAGAAAGHHAGWAHAGVHQSHAGCPEPARCWFAGLRREVHARPVTAGGVSRPRNMPVPPSNAMSGGLTGDPAVASPCTGPAGAAIASRVNRPRRYRLTHQRRKGFPLIYRQRREGLRDRSPPGCVVIPHDSSLPVLSRLTLSIRVSPPPAGGPHAGRRCHATGLGTRRHGARSLPGHTRVDAVLDLPYPRPEHGRSRPN